MVRLTLWRESPVRSHLCSSEMSTCTVSSRSQSKPTCSIYRKWWWRRWSRHSPSNSCVDRTDSCAVSRRHGARRDHCADWRGGQDGDVSISLLVDLDGALLLQLVDLLLQLRLPLDGLVFLLHHLPQRDHLRAGVFVDLLRRRGQKQGSSLQRRLKSKILKDSGNYLLFTDRLKIKST